MAEDLDYIPMPDNVVALINKTWAADIKLEVASKCSRLRRCAPLKSRTSAALQPPRAWLKICDDGKRIARSTVSRCTVVPIDRVSARSGRLKSRTTCFRLLTLAAALLWSW